MLRWIMESTIKFSEMQLDELLAIYRQLNPNVAPNFTFIKKDKAVQQVNFAFNQLAAKKQKTEAETELYNKYKDCVDKPKSLAEIAAEQGALTEDEMKAEGLVKDADGNIKDTKVKKEPTPKKTKEEIKAAMSAGTAASWTDNSIRVARCQRNYCTVNGEVFTSLIQAAKKFGWEKVQIALRKIVKLKGHIKFVIDDKTSYDIICLGATGEDLGNGSKTAEVINIADVTKVARSLQLKEVSDEEMAKMKAEAEAEAKRLADRKAKRLAEKEKKEAEKKAKAEARAKAKEEKAKKEAKTNSDDLKKDPQ